MKLTMSYRKLIMIALALVAAACGPGDPPDCSDLMPGPVSVHKSSKEIDIKKNAQILDHPGITLYTKKLSLDNSSTKVSCFYQDCEKKNENSEKYDVAFPGIISIKTFSVSSNSSGTIGATECIYFWGIPILCWSDDTKNNVNVYSNGHLYFDDQHDEYFINNMYLYSGSTVHLKVGKTYYVNNLDFNSSNVNIVVDGSGTAILMVNNSVSVTNGSLINSASLSVGGDSEKLIVYAQNDFTLKTSSAMTALLYSKKKFKLEDDSQFFGASAAEEAELNEDSVVTYQSDGVLNVDEGGLCVQATTADHFEYSHDGYGAYCLMETVYLTAIESGGGISTKYENTVKLETNTDAGQWVLLNGKGYFIESGTTDDGEAYYTYDKSDNGVVTLGLLYTTGDAAVDVEAEEAGNPIVDDDDSEGILNFFPSGFSITQTPLTNPVPGPVNDPIVSQEAGTNFNFYISAYGQDPDDGTCGVIEGYEGSQNLHIWSSYVNPGTGTLFPDISGTTITGSQGTTPSISVAFTDGQSAAIVGSYPDVGQISLNLQSVVTTPYPITGNTNNFVVSPADFVVTSVVGSGSEVNPQATSSSGGVFLEAGKDFTVTVEARNSLGAVTPNYGNEATPEGVKSLPVLFEPSGGSSGVIANASAFTKSGNEFTNSTMSWDEVGILDLTIDVADNDYLGAGNATSLAPYKVGRFIPDHFDVSDNGPQLLSAGNCGYTYQGEAFTTVSTPAVTITAKNTAGVTTTNYGGDYWQLSAPARSYVKTSAGQGGVLSAVDSGTFAGESTLDGVAVFSVRGSGGVTVPSMTYDKAAITAAITDIPFSPSVDLTFSSAAMSDDDGVCYKNGGASCVDYVVTMAPLVPFEMYYGRLSVVNAVGSELLPLPMTAHTEYWQIISAGGNNNYGFVKNTADGNACSGTVLSALDFSLSNYLDALSSGETSLTYNGITNGVADFDLSAPGINNQGSVEIEVSGVPAWLRYDFDASSAGDEAPKATATFGIYAGDEPVIYMREGYQ